MEKGSRKKNCIHTRHVFDMIIFHTKGHKHFFILATTFYREEALRKRKNDRKFNNDHKCTRCAVFLAKHI